MATNGRTLSHDRTLRVAGAQIRNVVGDLAGNGEQILAAMSEAEEAGADVVVFPELALTGYPLADLVCGRSSWMRPPPLSTSSHAARG